VEDSIVKSLVSLHHGRIGYQSTAGISGETASSTSNAAPDEGLVAAREPAVAAAQAPPRRELG